jgi:hypothetical protein
MICSICGNEFQPKNNRKKYCSPECYHIKNRQYARKKSEANYYFQKGKFKCPMCGLQRSKSKHCFCFRCKQDIEREGIEDTLSQECGVFAP